MPLVQIHALRRPGRDLTALGDAVHQAMTETIDVPADDLFQVLHQHDPGHLRYHPGYLGIERDDDVVFVAITMRAGRTVEQKRALYRRITELAAERAGIEPRNVLVTITENQLCDWSFGDGVAQLVAGERQP
ncbi:tautomerase family protein [Actinophytocola xanthii]|uniref:Tautomerase family protein n=1 Tax=Actinophytocola xanthii TaxID=1912961 RepID=A0A1Q8CJZ2_9PSEU|nr:tautomerase family protein [Actinophytocola xanthii]OLF14685.1 tautomerase family protein [Actinophytocola xanthii]